MLLVKNKNIADLYKENIKIEQGVLLEY